jgi:hypothetical protein
MTKKPLEDTRDEMEKLSYDHDRAMQEIDLRYDFKGNLFDAVYEVRPEDRLRQVVAVFHAYLAHCKAENLDPMVSIDRIYRSLTKENESDGAKNADHR